MVREVCRENPGVSNLAEVFYEFAGFIGLGPPRNEIRSKFSLDIFLEYKYTLLPYSTLLLAFAAGVFILLAKKKKLGYLYNSYSVAFIVTMVFFYFAARVEHFRFWARHSAFLYPVLIFYMQFYY